MPIRAISIPRWWFFPLVLAVLLVPGAVSALQPEAELKETLEAIRDLERSQEERQAALQELERQIGELARGTGETRGELRRLEEARAAQAEVIGEHEERVRREEQRLNEERAAAARLVRDQWLRERHAGRIGSGNADSDPDAGRHHAQFGVYIREAREEALQALRDQLQGLERARADLVREQEVLARQGEEMRAVIADLEREQRRQRRAMAELEAVIDDEALELERLRRNAETLEAVIRQVEEDAAARARREASGGAPDTRVSPDVAFSALRGELPRPAEGSVIRSFNQARGSRLRSRWRGAVLDVANGEPVRAVHYGRVVYADWMQGYGFLVILDHGHGYLTLYSNLEEILTAEDETVDAGGRLGVAGEGSEAIAPGLYFEIRKNGDPLDPEGWWPAR